MKLSRTLLFLFSFSFATLGTVRAQDIHYSLYDFSPLTLNPAQTGAFSGTARIGGIYRDQWFGFLNNSFKTPSFYIDAPIIRGFGENDWVGVGGVVISDKAGTANLRTNAFLFSAAYHWTLGGGKKGRRAADRGKTVLTIGAQGGSVSRRIDLANPDLIFEDEADPSVGGGGLGGGTSPDRKASEKTNFLDFAAGLMLRTELSEKSNLEIGTAVVHITQPDYSLLGTGTDEAKQRPMRITAHARLVQDLNEKWRLTPSVLFQTTKGSREIHAQIWAGVLLNDKKDMRLNFGTGYRFGDAVPVLVGLDIGDLRVAMAYDVNTSSLSQASNSVGGFEIAASYIIKIFKDPNVVPAILCPQF